MTNLIIKILGCGPSIGVPIPGCDCSVCISTNPRNNRTRTSLYINYENHKILIDCGPDLRHQVLREKISHFDTVLLTHKHSDHVAGMDDLRISFFNKNEKQIDCYGNKETIKICQNNFSHMFEKVLNNSEITNQDLNQLSEKAKPLIGRIIKPFEQFLINNLPLTALEQDHGKIKTIGYLFPHFAYCTDLNDMEQKNLDLLKNAKLKLWIVSLVHVEGNNAHGNLEKVTSWIEYIQPKKVVFTHMSHRIDYCNCEFLKDNWELGYDGMEIIIPV